MKSNKTLVGIANKLARSASMRIHESISICASCLRLTKPLCSLSALRAMCSANPHATDAWTTFASVLMRPSGLVAPASRFTYVFSAATLPFGKKCSRPTAKSSGTGAPAKNSHMNPCRTSAATPPAARRRRPSRYPLTS